jgi:hypothetical protein
MQQVAAERHGPSPPELAPSVVPREMVMAHDLGRFLEVREGFQESIPGLGMPLRLLDLEAHQIQTFVQRKRPAIVQGCSEKNVRALGGPQIDLLGDRTRDPRRPQVMVGDDWRDQVESRRNRKNQISKANFKTVPAIRIHGRLLCRPSPGT